MKTFTQKMIVEKKHAASELGSGFLDVFATPAMIAFMENTASKVIDNLEEGYPTVGIEINVKHQKASKIGEQDSCIAILIKREKRIYGGGPSGPFMGSEFSFEDMSSQRVEKFTYKYMGDETLNDMVCHILERYPTDKGSGYTKQVAWLDTEHLRVHKVDYYDRRGELLKTLTATGYEQHDEKFWRPTTMEMLNHQTGRSTLLEWKNTKFNNNFTAREFEPNALRNAR